MREEENERGENERAARGEKGRMRGQRKGQACHFALTFHEPNEMRHAGAGGRKTLRSELK